MLALPTLAVFVRRPARGAPRRAASARWPARGAASALAALVLAACSPEPGAEAPGAARSAAGLESAAHGRAGAAGGAGGAAPAAAAEPDARPNPAAMDRKPARRTLSPDGRWDVRVAEGGGLSVRRAGAPDADAVRIDDEVDPRVAVAGDVLYYARAGEWSETDLWRVRLPDGAPERVTDWVGSEDRPVVSPDGARLAFVSGVTGFASWWVVSLETLPAATGTQVTNVGVKRGRPGVAPEGWVPVPDGTVYGWTDAGLSWVAEERTWTATVPQ